jgi:outer membrane PBP1 activator LpoA protein
LPGQEIGDRPRATYPQTSPQALQKADPADLAAELLDRAERSEDPGQTKLLIAAARALLQGDSRGVAQKHQGGAGA